MRNEAGKGGVTTTPSKQYIRVTGVVTEAQSPTCGRQASYVLGASPHWGVAADKGKMRTVHRAGGVEWTQLGGVVEAK